MNASKVRNQVRRPHYSLRRAAPVVVEGEGGKVEKQADLAEISTTNSLPTRKTSQSDIAMVVIAMVIQMNNVGTGMETPSPLTKIKSKETTRVTPL